MIVGVVSAFALGAVMLTVRGHLSVSTAALALVIPVVAGAVIGGLGAGALGVLAGFFVYDFFFIPPYNTLSVDTAQDWEAIGVYVVVMLLVARVVDRLEVARADAQRGREIMRRVAELSELLVRNQPVEDLLRNIVGTAHSVFHVPGVALLQLDEGRLVVVASAGEPLSPEELRQLDPQSGTPVHVGAAGTGPGDLRTISLSPSGRPVGILALKGAAISESDSVLLDTFANDSALALERAGLREQALKTQLLEEADRFRRGLLGAVSHDLRTPLATIKVASSTLLSRGELLPAKDAKLLHQLIEIESDRLTRLVTNLLDMTRIEAGVLTLQREATSVRHLVDEALGAMRTTLIELRMEVQISDSLPLVMIDRVLMGQVLVNLLDNASRHAPEHSVITVTGESRNGAIVLSVSDHGSGVAREERTAIFDRFTQLGTGGRAGLGLTIAKTFVEAHEESLWYEEVLGGGASFVFSLPAASAVTSE
jgi:two-component system sensor histidine kinase KdpD